MELDNAESTFLEQVSATASSASKDSFVFSNSQLQIIPDSIEQLAGRIVLLDLAKNRISAIPPCLSQFALLTTLRLRANALTEFPEGILGGLRLLQELDLMDNQIDSLPSDLGSAGSLEKLYVTGNFLTSLPDSITQLSNLRELVVSENQITALPDGIGALQSLEKLDAQENALARLPASLTGCVALRALYLQNNQLTELPDKMWLLESLSALQLHENPFDENRLPQKLLFKRSKAILSYLLAISEGRVDDANELLEYSMNVPVRQKSASRLSAAQQRHTVLESRQPFTREPSGFKSTVHSPPSPRYEPVAAEIPSGIVTRASMSLRRASTIEPSKDSSSAINPARPRPSKPAVLSRAPTQITDAEAAATPPVSARSNRPPSQSVSATGANYAISPRPNTGKIGAKQPAIRPNPPAKPGSPKTAHPTPGHHPMRPQISVPHIGPNQQHKVAPSTPSKIQNNNPTVGLPVNTPKQNPPSIAHIEPNNTTAIIANPEPIKVEPTVVHVQPVDIPSDPVVDVVDIPAQPIADPHPADPIADAIPQPVRPAVLEPIVEISDPIVVAPEPTLSVEPTIVDDPIISPPTIGITEPDFVFDPVGPEDPVVPEDPPPVRPTKKPKPKPTAETVTVGVATADPNASPRATEDTTSRGRPKTRRILDSENPVGTPFYTAQDIAYLPRKVPHGPLLKLTSKRFVMGAQQASQAPKWSDIFSPSNLALLPTSAYTGYGENFQNSTHLNFVGEDQVDGGYVIVSLKTVASQNGNSCVVRTKDGDSVLQITLPAKPPKNPSGWLLFLRRNAEFSAVVPKHVKLFHVTDSAFPATLSQLERKLGRTDYKIGVVYAKEGQTEEEEYLSNDRGSSEFDEFLNFLGDRITLQGWSKYDGGLDTSKNATGKHSVFTEWRDLNIMFHVSTLLPLLPEGNGDDDDEDRTQEKKVHIGNDIVVVVFLEGEGEDSSFNPRKFVSHFNHSFILVSPVRQKGLTLYRINTVYKAAVPTCLPDIPADSIFEKSDQLRELLLAKIVNSDRAACQVPEFASSLASLRYHQLYNAGKQYQGKPSQGCFCGGK